MEKKIVLILLMNERRIHKRKLEEDVEHDKIFSLVGTIRMKLIAEIVNVEIVDAKEKNLKKQTLQIRIEKNNKFFDQMYTGVGRMMNSERFLNF